MHHGTKDGVGAEALRLGLDLTKPGVARRRFLSADELTVGSGDDLPLTAAQGKQNGTAGGDVHLHRVARVLQFFAALQQEIVQLIALGEGAVQNGSGNSVQAIVERVQQNEAEVLEDTREKVGKGAAVGGHRGVAFAENLTEGLAKSGLGVTHQLRDFVAQGNAADGLRMVRQFWQLKAAELAVVKPGSVANLVNVVVFGGHPEHRDGVDPGGGELLRGANGRKGFVKRVGRASEEADLLPADHRHRAILKSTKILLGFFTTAVNHVLLTENVGHFTASFGGKRKLFGNGDDGLEFR